MVKHTYFRGYRVNLTGETEVLHGGTFHKGVYAEGPQNGEPVLIAERFVEQERAASRRIEMDIYTR